MPIFNYNLNTPYSNLKTSLKTPLDESLKAAHTADSSFQSKQWKLHGSAVTTRLNYFYLAVRKLQHSSKEVFNL